MPGAPAGEDSRKCCCWWDGGDEDDGDMVASFLVM